MRMKYLLSQGLLGLACVLGSGSANAEVVVIVSAKSQVVSLNINQVANIFLGRSSRYPSGGEAIPIDQPEDSPLRQEFYAKTARMSPSMLKEHWSKLVFTGRGQPPREAASSDAVKKMVAENPKLLGYIDRSAVDAGVRIVLVPE